MASAHKAVSIRNDSLNAASRAGLLATVDKSSPWAARRHSSTMPHRLTPADPPSMRMKLIALAPCAIRSGRSPRIAPRFSEGRMKPSPMRPSTVNATTYQIGVPSVTTRISANDSANESVRRVRRSLDPLIGRPAQAGFAEIVKSLVIAELDRQVADGVIRDYQSVAVFDLGDTFNVEYELAALEPLNFIRVTANLTRILASAA